MNTLPVSKPNDSIFDNLTRSFLREAEFERKKHVSEYIFIGAGFVFVVMTVVAYAIPSIVTYYFLGDYAVLVGLLAFLNRYGRRLAADIQFECAFQDSLRELGGEPTSPVAIATDTQPDIDPLTQETMRAAATLLPKK